MIKECNFKYRFKKGHRKGETMCELSISSLSNCNSYTTGIIHKKIEEDCYESILPKKCSGEDKCILFQIYKSLTPTTSYREVFEKGFKKGYKDDPFIRVICDYCGHIAIRKEEYDGICPHCDRVLCEV